MFPIPNDREYCKIPEKKEHGMGRLAELNPLNDGKKLHSKKAQPCQTYWRYIQVNA